MVKDPHAGPRGGGVGGLTGHAATAADPEKIGVIASDVNTFFETQCNSKHKIVTSVSKTTTRITFPDPKVLENMSSGHILSFKVDQNPRPSTFGVLAVAQSWSREVSAPLSGCPGRYPGPSKTTVFLKETATFSPCASHRSRTHAGTATRVQLNTFEHLSPPPLPS